MRHPDRMTPTPAPPTPTHWGRAILGVALVGALIFGCIWAYTGLGPEPASDRPGRDSVYEHINSTTDCTQLQADFNRYEASGRQARERDDLESSEANTAYMGAAERRMRELGC